MTVKSVIEKISRERLGVETLKVANVEHEDFHDLPVWDIQDALTAAYHAGQNDVLHKQNQELRRRTLQRFGNVEIQPDLFIVNSKGLRK